jgi:hypothetical protein
MVVSSHVLGKWEIDASGAKYRQGLVSEGYCQVSLTVQNVADWWPCDVLQSHEMMIWGSVHQERENHFLHQQTMAQYELYSTAHHLCYQVSCVQRVAPQDEMV